MNGSDVGLSEMNSLQFDGLCMTFVFEGNIDQYYPLGWYLLIHSLEEVYQQISSPGTVFVNISPGTGWHTVPVSKERM